MNARIVWSAAALLIAALAGIYSAFGHTEVIPRSSTTTAQQRKDEGDNEARESNLEVLPAREQEGTLAAPSDEAKPRGGVDEITNLRYLLRAYLKRAGDRPESVKELSDEEVVFIHSQVAPTKAIRTDIADDGDQLLLSHIKSLGGFSSGEVVAEWPDVDPDHEILLKRRSRGRKIAKVIDTRNIEGYAAIKEQLAALDHDLVNAAAASVRKILSSR